MRVVSDVLVRVLPTLWLGLVAGISLIETPLKFQAPGITLERGLGIGRLVFHALNEVELAIAVLLVLAIFIGNAATTKTTRIALAVAIVALLVQVIFVRPVLDRRLDQRVAGKHLASSYVHVGYIGLEGAKILALLTTGIAMAAATARGAHE